jgi:sporulation protein YlmC with PRC-barrel domain
MTPSAAARSSIAAAGLLACVLALGAAPHACAAQDAPPTPPANTADAPAPPPAPPKPVAATDPALAVAQVKLEGGYRASKVIGAAVYNGQNQQIGTIDDLIFNHDNQASLAVISVGGFLGVGGKMVAVPYGKIERTDDGKVLMQDGSKESLAKLPSFSYAQ